MHHNLNALLAAAADAAPSEVWLASRRRRFSLELDRRGLFLRLGGVEAYLCAEPQAGWSLRREPGGLDAHAWRLHLIVGRVPG